MRGFIRIIFKMDILMRKNILIRKWKDLLI